VRTAWRAYLQVGSLLETMRSGEFSPPGLERLLGQRWTKKKKTTKKIIQITQFQFPTKAAQMLKYGSNN
jgi:hypothetical protein